LLYAPTGVTLKKNVLSAHTVFMRFGFILEQTLNFALYYINWLGFVTEMEGVTGRYELGL